MVERATKAVEHARIDCHGTDEEIARAVIATMREPTPAMTMAGDEDIDFHWDHGGMDDGAGADAWRAMIDAALK